MSYALSLLLTVTLEVPVVCLVLRRVPWRRSLACALAANLVSHPAIHFLMPRLVPVDPLGRFLLVAEVLVLLFEAAVYVLVARPRPWVLGLAASAAANLVSFAVGLALVPGPA